MEAETLLRLCPSGRSGPSGCKTFPGGHGRYVPDWLAGIAALAATGLATGFIAGLLGIGGGAFLIAGMVLFVGMNQHIAQGSSLLSMVPAAAVGSWTHWRHGNVVTRILPGLATGIIIGAFLGGVAANHLPEQTLRVIFAVMLIWLGVDLIRKSRLRVMIPLHARVRKPMGRLEQGNVA